MRRDGALSYLEPLETTTRGVAVLDALADMIERAGPRGRRPPAARSLAGRDARRRPLHHPRGAQPLGRARHHPAPARRRHLSLRPRADLAGAWCRPWSGSRARRCCGCSKCAGRWRTTWCGRRRSTPPRRSGPRSRGSATSCSPRSTPAGPGARPTRPSTAPSTTPRAIRCSARSCTSSTRRWSARASRPFGRDAFGLDSFPPHRELADAIVAADPERACAAINHILDIVEDEIRAIIAVDVK